MLCKHTHTHTHTYIFKNFGLFTQFPEYCKIFKQTNVAKHIFLYQQWTTYHCPFFMETSKTRNTHWMTLRDFHRVFPNSESISKYKSMTVDPRVNNAHQISAINKQFTFLIFNMDYRNLTRQYRRIGYKYCDSTCTWSVRSDIYSESECSDVG